MALTILALLNAVGAAINVTLGNYGVATLSGLVAIMLAIWSVPR